MALIIKRLPLTHYSHLISTLIESLDLYMTLSYDLRGNTSITKILHPIPRFQIHCRGGIMSHLISSSAPIFSVFLSIIPPTVPSDNPSSLLSSLPPSYSSTALTASPSLAPMLLLLSWLPSPRPSPMPSCSHINSPNVGWSS